MKGANSTARLITATVISLSTVLSSNFYIAAQAKESNIVNSNLDSRVAQLGNMTGVYGCDDAGTYYVRQIGNQVWWYGESSDSGSSWSNVFKGTVFGRTVRGEWADVPRGSIRQNGIMIVERTGPGTFRAIKKTGGFGGSTWTLGKG